MLNLCWPADLMTANVRRLGCMQVPYGTAFHSNVQWACQHVAKGKCKLRVTGQVEFTKGCFVKGVITKATQEVMMPEHLLHVLS